MDKTYFLVFLELHEIYFLNVKNGLKMLENTPQILSTQQCCIYTQNKFQFLFIVFLTFSRRLNHF